MGGVVETGGLPRRTFGKLVETLGPIQEPWTLFHVVESRYSFSCGGSFVLLPNGIFRLNLCMEKTDTKPQSAIATMQLAQMQPLRCLSKPDHGPKRATCREATPRPEGSLFPGRGDPRSDRKSNMLVCNEDTHGQVRIPRAKKT